MKLGILKLQHTNNKKCMQNQVLMADKMLMNRSSSDEKMGVVSKMYCSSSKSLLVVRRKLHVVMGGGFVVTDCSQRTLFRVDGCGVIGKIGDVALQDAHGHPLLSLQRKDGLMHVQWRGYTLDYQGGQRLAFTLKDPTKSCFPCSNPIRIWTQPRMNNAKDWDFEIRGYFPDKDCSIVDSQGNVIAQTGMITEIRELMSTQDLYHVVVSAGVDQAFVVGVIMVLDSIYCESTIC